jgi:hypothetical protein
MGSMNDDLVNMSRELVKKNRMLEKLKSERDERVTELESALDMIKKLEGIIPMCMYCKKIRDDHDYWHKLENYLVDHSEALISHGICPTCLEMHFPVTDSTDSNKK